MIKKKKPTRDDSHDLLEGRSDSESSDDDYGVDFFELMSFLVFIIIGWRN